MHRRRATRARRRALEARKCTVNAQIRGCSGSGDPELQRLNQSPQARRCTVNALSEPVGALCKRADYVLCSRSGALELQRRADTPSVEQDRLSLTRTTETRRYPLGALSEPVGALCKRADTWMFKIWRARTTEARRYATCRARAPELDRAQTTEVNPPPNSGNPIILEILIHFHLTANLV